MKHRTCPILAPARTTSKAKRLTATPMPARARELASAAKPIAGSWLSVNRGRMPASSICLKKASTKSPGIPNTSLAP